MAPDTGRMNKPTSSHEQDDGEEPHEEQNTGALPQAVEWHYYKVLELPSPPIEEIEEQWEEARWHSRQKIEWNYKTRGWQWANGWGGLRQTWNQRSCPSSSWHFETGWVPAPEVWNGNTEDIEKWQPISGYASSSTERVTQVVPDPSPLAESPKQAEGNMPAQVPWQLIQIEGATQKDQQTGVTGDEVAIQVTQ